MFSYASDD
ncbi:MAG: hypothetical protein EZS28_022108, partial [Streblomastix strix]